jgi:Family of unknown function (DUF6461)
VIAHYQDFLARAGALSPALTWTVVQPLTGPLSLTELLARMGLGESDVVATCPVDTTLEFEFSMSIGQVGPSFVILEPNGYQTDRLEVLHRLSASARVCGVSWGITGASRLEYWIYGRLVTHLEIHSPDWRHGDQPHALDEELTILEQVSTWPAYPDHHRAAAMAVVEAVTGVRLDLDWLVQPHAMVRREAAVPRIELPPGSFGWLDPDLDARLRLADPSVQALAVLRAVTEVLAQHELLDEPSVRAGLDLLASGQIAAYPPGLVGRDSLTYRLQGDYEAHRFEVPPDQDPRRARWQAAEALGRAFAPWEQDVFQPLMHVYYAAGDHWPSVRRILKGLLD